MPKRLNLYLFKYLYATFPILLSGSHWPRVIWEAMIRDGFKTIVYSIYIYSYSTTVDGKCMIMEGENQELVSYRYHYVSAILGEEKGTRVSSHTHLIWSWP